jgi:hypothetical protein
MSVVVGRRPPSLMHGSDIDDDAADDARDA